MSALSGLYVREDCISGLTYCDAFCNLAHVLRHIVHDYLFGLRGRLLGVGYRAIFAWPLELAWDDYTAFLPTMTGRPITMRVLGRLRLWRMLRRSYHHDGLRVLVLEFVVEAFPALAAFLGEQRWRYLIYIGVIAL